MNTQERLEELRQALNDENISMGELIELQGLADHIDPSDVQLLEAAGVPEFPERRKHFKVWIELEEYDPETDEYTSLEGYLNFAATGTFDTLEEAEAFAEAIHNVYAN